MNLRELWGDPRVLQLRDFLRSIAPPETQDDDLLSCAYSIIAMVHFMPLMDLPRATPSDADRAKKELAKLAMLASELVGHLASMHATSLDAVRDMGRELRVGGEIPFPDPILLMADAQKIALVADRAKDIAAFPNALSQRSTRPMKRAERQFAELVAAQFQRVTGSPPTMPKKDGKAYGPFYDMLKLSFHLAGIFPNASAENMGREAIKAMEISRPKVPR